MIQHFISPINETSCHLRIKTTKDIHKIDILFGDPHDYKKIDEKTYVWNQSETHMSLYQETNDYHYFSGIISHPLKRLRYYFKLNNQNYYGQKGYFNDNTVLDLYATFFYPYIHSHEIFHPNPWVKDQVWMQIFVDRFNNGKPENDPENVLTWESTPFNGQSIYGGDLKGITLKLDDIVKQGFTGLYLTPIFTSPSNHKYDTIDYFEIDPHFGTKEELKELIDECHKRNLKILLDAVFNHSGYFFKPFQDVLLNKEKSVYKDWFHIHSFDPFDYETFSVVKNMPKLNTHNPEVQDYLLKVLHYYLREFKIDGWRFDVANELDHSFIKRINRELKAAYPDVYLLAEIWHDPQSFVAYDEFDGVMEYEMSDVFTQYLLQELSVVETIQRLSDCAYRLEPNAQLDQFHLVDSHDTARIMTKLKGDYDLALMALTHLSLLKGSICLFYGTHFLLEGENDPYCRLCYPLHPTSDQLVFEQKIIEIINFRKHHLDIINTETPQLKRSDHNLIYHFSTFDVIFNLDKKTSEIIIQNTI